MHDILDGMLALYLFHSWSIIDIHVQHIEGSMRAPFHVRSVGKFVNSIRDNGVFNTKTLIRMSLDPANFVLVVSTKLPFKKMDTCRDVDVHE